MDVLERLSQAFPRPRPRYAGRMLYRRCRLLLARDRHRIGSPVGEIVVPYHGLFAETSKTMEDLPRSRFAARPLRSRKTYPLFSTDPNGWLAMNLFQSAVILLVGLIVNLGAIYCMHKSNHLKPLWSPYLLGIALGIVLAQLCLVLASRNERLPLDIVIAVHISFVILGSAILINTIDPTRVISNWEWFFYGIAIVGALGVGVAKQFHS